MTTDFIVIDNVTYYQFEDTQIYASIHGKCANKLTGKVFSDNKQNTGYLAIFFRNLVTGKARRMSVHRIICSVYHKNLDPSSFTQVDHINGNKHDNRACNLRFVTPKQNSYYKNHEQNIKWKAPRYSDYKKATIILLKELGYSNHKIAKCVGIHPSTVAPFLKQNNKKDTI